MDDQTMTDLITSSAAMLAEIERLRAELSHAGQWREAYAKEIDRLRALLTKANDELERISTPEDGVDAFCAEIAKVLGVEPLHQQGRDTEPKP